MRIALGVEYNGSAFKGWQRQVGARTVQGALESALSVVADENIKLVCAGRTDSGVHAHQQIVHFDTHAQRRDRSWVLGCNSNLPDDVCVLWARPMPEHFHARFSALSRAYEYVILNRQARPGLWHGKVAWECRPLAASLMHQAAQHWIGEHDFSSFRAKGCQAAHPVRTIFSFEVNAVDGCVVLSVTANAFLMHMVRNFAGVLIEVGIGHKPPQWAGEVLAARIRERAGVTAQPAGLYLAAVHYPEEFALPRANTGKLQLPCYSGPSFEGG